MIELRWTDAAAADLERIADYLFEQTPEHAARVVRAIYDAPAKLREPGAPVERWFHAVCYKDSVNSQ